MKPTTLLLSIGLSCLAACSGSDGTHLHFTDVNSAMSQAEAAAAAENSETALAAFAYAILEGDAEVKAEALQGLLQFQLKQGAESDAMDTFARLTRECADSVKGSDVVKFLQTADAQNLAEAGQTMIAYSSERFPEIRDELIKLEASFQDLRLNAPSEGSDMKGIGYVDSDSQQ